MTSVLFSGCSYVEGFDMENLHRNPGHFSHVLSNNLFGADYTIDNIGVGGYSNERIFLDSAQALTKNHYDYAFICWTSLHRYYFWAGLETYPCWRALTPGMTAAMTVEHKGNDISWTKKQLVKFGKQFLLLMHAHYYIRDLVSYVNILISLAESKGTKIFFVNNILPFDQGYFNHIQGHIVPTMLTEYTNELLNSDNRDDEQINELYHMMHEHYKEKGGIREEYWLNLYQSFFNSRIDFTNDGIHPGFKSHKQFAEILTEQVKKHN